MTVTESTSLQRLRTEEHSTLGDLTRELFRQQDTKRDYVVDTRRMSFHTTEWTREPNADERVPGASYLTFDSPDDAHDQGTNGGPLNQYAHGQVRARLGIPAKYYDRMRMDAPELLDSNVLHWFHNEPETRMVRMLDGKVRAFLSDRYRRLDNLDLMEQAVLPELARYEGDLVFHNSALTDSRLYIRAILPGLAADIQPQGGVHTFVENGDIVHAGVEIRNSEVGNGALSAAPFIWRLRCLNGLVIADRTLSRYHVGRAQEEDAYAIYRDDTLAADDAAFFLKVRDAVAAALSDVQFEQIVGQLREAAGSERIQDPVKATEELAKSFDLDEREQSGVLRYLAEGGDLSKWGAVNAVTSAAKDADDFTRQAEMESMGGALVALPATEWAKIAR